jgi:hypothetical protein
MSRKISVHGTEDTLTPGKTFETTVRIELDEPTRVRGIKARFYGAERTEASYTTTSVDSKGRMKTNHHTAVDYVPIVEENFVLHGAPSTGFVSGIGDAVSTMFGGGQSETMDAGSYDFTVSFAIPKDAPPSLEGKKCSVFYRLEIQIDVPIWPDPKLDYAFELLRLPTPLEETSAAYAKHPNSEKGRGFWDKTLGKDIEVEVAIDSDVLVAGQESQAMVAIKANEPFKLDQISLAMIGLEKSRAGGHNDSYSHVRPLHEVEINKSILTELNREFAFTATTDGPYTTTGQNFSVDWFVEVRLDVPWANNPYVRIPIRYVES